MPKTNAEYQREHRQRRAERMAGLEREHASLTVRLARAEAARDAAVADVERLEAELASGPVPRCERCRTELACPHCYRAGDDY